MLRQVHVEVFFGVVFYVEKSVEKVIPKGPQGNFKSRRKSIESVFRRGLEKGTSKWDPLQDQKIRYVVSIYYTLERSEV